MVWFGEALDPGVLTAVEKELDICDLCLVVSGAFLTCPLNRQGGHARDMATPGQSRCICASLRELKAPEGLWCPVQNPKGPFSLKMYRDYSEVKYTGVRD